MARPQVFNQQQVISKAIECFWLKGYSETTMSDLLQAMNISRSSFYNSFGDKRQLFELCLETYGQQAQQIASMTLGGSTLSGLKAIKQFLMLVLVTPVSDLSKRGCLLVNTIAETAMVDQALNAQASALMSPVKAGLIKQLRTVFNEKDSVRHGEWLFTQLLGWRLQAQMGLEAKIMAEQIEWSLAQLAPPLADEITVTTQK